MNELLISIGDDLVLTDARATAGTPGHDVSAFVEPALLPAALEETPDLIVVLIGEGEVGTAQLGQAQSADDLLHRAGHRSVGSFDGDHPRRVLAQLVAQPAQLIRVVPIHPHAQADGLLGLDGGVVEYPLLAEDHERGDAVVLDVLLGLETQVALHVDLDPQTLAVEAVLPALVVALHGLEALVQVLVGTPPGVVHTKGIIGCGVFRSVRQGRR